MITLKTLNEVVQSIINNIHDKLSDVDTKEGTFLRDVFIDPIADEIVGLNFDMKMLEYSQSILTATGEDLDRLASNYNVTRKSARSSSGRIRFYIKNPNVDFVISGNTTIATQATYAEEAKQFITNNTKSIYYIHDRNNPPVSLNSEYINETYDIIFLDSLTLSSNGYYYYDIEATSASAGAIYNVGANTIVNKIDTLDNNILSFTNPIAFTGGTDEESDMSLAFRIKLALQGANIGTKYGYLSYVLKQDSVEDAKVVAAGDKDMIRDLNNEGIHDGGKVDIYIKGQELVDNSLTITLNNNNTYFEDGNIYTNLDIEDDNKPINSIKSITYTIDDVIYNYTNIKNYEYENSYLSFEELATLNIEENIMQIINDICNLYNLTVVSRTDELNTRNLLFNVYGTLDDSSDYKYRYDDITAPYMFYVYKNYDNQNIIIEFVFARKSETEEDVYYEDQRYYIVKCLNEDEEETFYNYNYSTESNKTYYKDNILSYSVLFPTYDDNGEFLNKDQYISDTVYRITQNNDAIDLFYDYLLSTDVQNSILLNLDYIKNTLLNYEYDLDFGMETITDRVMYSTTNIYVNIEDSTENVDYVTINVKMSNNPNIKNGYFNLSFDNSNGYINPDDFILDEKYNYNYVPSEDKENIELNNILFSNNEELDDNNIIIFSIQFKKIQNANFQGTISNVHLYDENRYLFKYNIGNVTITFYSKLIIEQMEDNDNIILYYINEHRINTNCYKIDLLFPLSLISNNNVVNYNIPITFVKKQNNLYIRTYYNPDYELLNVNETLNGNSKSAYYKILWHNDPLNTLDGNITITIDYDTNELIKNLQTDIDNIKCLTADVLVKEAEEYPIEVIMGISFEDTQDEETTRNNIINSVTDYINNSFSLGGTLKKSDIVVLVQNMDGVDYVDSCSMELRKIYEANQSIITINDYQYFKLNNIIVNAL